jgi:hypothetical protein
MATWGDVGGSFGTKRSREIIAVGHDMTKGGLMPEDLHDKVMSLIATWAEDYREELGAGVERRIRVEEMDEEIIIFTVYRTKDTEPGDSYRLMVSIVPEQM